MTAAALGGGGVKIPLPVQGEAEPKGHRVSDTDKTRPYQIKKAELEGADPYRARRGMDSVPSLWGCKSSCWQCRGPQREDRRQVRRQGKRAAREGAVEWEGGGR